MLADPKALHHVFQASGYRYPKNHDTNQAIRLMMGRGIFWLSVRPIPLSTILHYANSFPQGTIISVIKGHDPAFDIIACACFFPFFQRSAAWYEKIVSPKGNCNSYTF